MGFYWIELLEKSLVKKKISRSDMTTLTISKKGNIMKIAKFLKKPSLLIKDVSETVKKEAKQQKGGFIHMLISTLGASLLRNMLAGKGVI